MGSFFSSTSHDDAPPPGVVRPAPSPTSSCEVRPQKRLRVGNVQETASKGEKKVDFAKYKFKKLVRAHREKAEGLPKSAEVGKEEVLPVDLSKVYVWYASYGSNLLEERFLCYLKGGKLESANLLMPPCSDPMPPTVIKVFEVPHRLFFAYEKTVTWGPGGVAFISSKEAQDSTTIVRAYRITLQQFNEVAHKENSASAPVDAIYVSPEHLTQLRSGSKASFAHESPLLKGKYRAVQYLGDYQDDPVLTFTPSQAQQDDILSGHVPLTPPSEKYRSCIVRGLVEIGVSEEDAQQYVDERANTPLLEGNAEPGREAL